VDFAARRLTLMQPSEALLRGRIEPGTLDPAALKAELFGRYVQTAELDCNGAGPDALTRELRDFVGCVLRRGAPRVDGAAGRDARELAARVLDGIAAHRWDGHQGGPAGPHALPTPRGPLFTPAPGREAA